MKETCILHIMGMKPTKFGGLEHFLIELARDLSKHHIRLLLMYNKIPDSEKYVEVLKSSNVEVIVTNSLNPFRFFFDFLRIMFKYKPAIIHAHFQPLYSLLFAKLLGLKNKYVTLHSMVTDNNLKEVYSIKDVRMRSRIIRILINFSSDKIITVSDAVKVQYQSLFPSTKSKLKTIYLGALPNQNNRVISKEKLKFYDNCIYIGCIVFSSRIKGADILIEATKILKDEYLLKNFKVCLIGLNELSPYTGELKELSKKYNLTNCIEWFGIRDDVSDLLPAMDIYCQPSRTEALGLAILEASMAGLPSIASDIGGIPEVILHNRTGYTFGVENSRELAKFLNALIKDGSLRKEMGYRAQEYINQKFNVSIQVNELVYNYLESLAN